MSTRTFHYDGLSPELHSLEGAIAYGGDALGNDLALVLTGPVDEDPTLAHLAIESVMENFRSLSDADREEAIRRIDQTRRDLGLIATFPSDQ